MLMLTITTSKLQACSPGWYGHQEVDNEVNIVTIYKQHQNHDVSPT